MVISRAFKNCDCHGPAMAIEIDGVPIIVTQSEVEARYCTWIEAYGVPRGEVPVNTDLVMGRIDYYPSAYVLGSCGTN